MLKNKDNFKLILSSIKNKEKRFILFFDIFVIAWEKVRTYDNAIRKAGELMKVICIGEMLIDFTPGNQAHSYIANPGGAPANVAVSVVRSGGQAGFLGKLGEDDFGKVLVNTLKKENVEILCPRLTKDAVTTLAFVSLDENGNRSFTFARKPGADMLLSKEDVEAVDLSNCKVVHAGSVSQSAEPEGSAVLDALRKAKELGKLISFDVNYRDTIWSREDCLMAIKEIFSLVDLLKLSDEELFFVGGEENIANFMKINNIAVVVVTMGSEGAKIYFDGQVDKVEAMKVQAVDTTGAGDSFWGAFLTTLLEQQVEEVSDITMDKLLKAGKYGAIASGLCVQKMGGIPAIPYRGQIDNLVREE